MKLTLPVFLIFFSLSTFAQSALPNSCETTPSAQVDLVSDGVVARLTTGGDLWWDGHDGRYLVSDDPDSLTTQPVSTLFSGGLWFAGRDPGGGLKGAFQQYGRSSGLFDFGPGPLDQDGVTDSLCANWDRFFGISRPEVEQFQELLRGDFETDEIPVNVLGWPASGNPFFADVHGFDLPANDFELAPFWDENRDGVYNPSDGDYPAFCGDQAYWCVFNDAVLHRQSATPNQAQAEIHLLAYSYNTPSDGALFRTTFYDFSIFNRAQEDMLDMYAGIWLDFDVGCFSDDLVGTIPEYDLVYAYNETAQDNSPCFQGIADFGDAAPVQIAQMVNSNAGGEGNLYASGSYLSEILGNPPSQIIAPGTVEEYYYYLRGLWRDGQPIRRRNTGLSQTGDTTRYIFDGGLTPQGAPWRACTQGGIFGTYNPIASTGPYNLQPGQSAEFTLAMTTVLGVDYPDECPDISPVIVAAEAVRAAYDAGCQRSDLTSTEALSAPVPFNVHIYPNPSSNRVTFAMMQNRTIRQVEIFDALGRPLFSQSGGDNNIEVDLRSNGLETGIYVYRLTDVQGSIFTGKVILRD